MSIADHFEHAPDAGFVRDYDSASARRQFNVSLVLVVVIALAAAALGVLVRFDAPAGVGNDAGPSQSIPAQSVPAQSVPAQSMPAYVGKL